MKDKPNLLVTHEKIYFSYSAIKELETGPGEHLKVFRTKGRNISLGLYLNKEQGDPLAVEERERFSYAYYIPNLGLLQPGLIEMVPERSYTISPGIIYPLQPKK